MSRQHSSKVYFFFFSTQPGSWKTGAIAQLCTQPAPGIVRYCPWLCLLHSLSCEALVISWLSPSARGQAAMLKLPQGAKVMEREPNGRDRRYWVPRHGTCSVVDYMFLDRRLNLSTPWFPCSYRTRVMTPILCVSPATQEHNRK